MASRKSSASKAKDDDTQKDVPAPTEEYIASVAAASWDGGRAFRIASGASPYDRQPWEFAPKGQARKHMDMVRKTAAGEPVEGDEPEEVIARALFRHYD